MQLLRTTALPIAATILLATASFAAEANEGEIPVPDTTHLPERSARPATPPDLTADGPSPADLPAPTPPPPGAARNAAPSTNVTINLINRLVEKGVLTQAEAAEMIAQAEADAAAAAQAQAATVALPPEPAPEEEMRITYIPEVVRNQMRDQIQQEVIARALEEKWNRQAEPGWTSKFRPFGDIRVRSENVFFPEGNANTGEFPDFNRINTGAPYDVSISNPDFAPQRNVDADRHRFRLRARAGADILLDDGFGAGLRLATGNDSSPTSTNQTLTGNFSKYSVWLDRAFIKYDAEEDEEYQFSMYAGRFDNPFLSTELHWDDDLGFDGLALRGKARVNDCVSAFFSGGYFPVFNTDFNFATNQPDKFASTDRWLTGAQLGIDWRIRDDLTARLGVAYYDFEDMRGRASSPFIPLAANDAGDTDSTRPPFAQNGNSYIPLRTIDNSTAANDFGNRYQYQYFGLASEFRNLTLTGRLDYDYFDPVRISLVGECTKNLAFDPDRNATVSYRTAGGGYDGGDSAWYLGLIVGKPALEAFGDWQVGLNYRHVESDAVVDAFTDSDFAAGTNAKGFSLGGYFALSRDVRCGVRWLSAEEIAGPPLRMDTLQLDLSARF